MSNLLAEEFKLSSSFKHMLFRSVYDFMYIMANMLDIQFFIFCDVELVNNTVDRNPRLRFRWPGSMCVTGGSRTNTVGALKLSGSHYIAQESLNLIIVLLQPSKCLIALPHPDLWASFFVTVFCTLAISIVNCILFVAHN